MSSRPKKEQTSNSDSNYEGDITEDPALSSLRIWMQEVQPIKLIKLSEDIMTQLVENWSKFRISVLKHLNQSENHVLDAMAKLRKEVQWLNQVKLGKRPQLNKITSRLFKECQQMQQKEIKFKLKQMIRQSKLVCDKILDTVKYSFEGVREKIHTLIQQFREFSSIKEILTEKTYFRFLQKKHHSDIELINETNITVQNQSHDMDFGALIGPTMTEANYRVAIKIQRNDRYQCFVGVGVCHPDIVKQKYYKGSGIGSGCYLIRQQSDCDRAISLSHAFQKEGTHKKPKLLQWGFGEGDIILVEMDFKKKMVCFSKGEQYYQMRVDLEQGPLNPYVVLHSKWDYVSILNQ